MQSKYATPIGFTYILYGISQNRSLRNGVVVGELLDGHDKDVFNYPQKSSDH